MQITTAKITYFATSFEAKSFSTSSVGRNDQTPPYATVVLQNFCENNFKKENLRLVDSISSANPKNLEFDFKRTEAMFLHNYGITATRRTDRSW